MNGIEWEVLWVWALLALFGLTALWMLAVMAAYAFNESPAYSASRLERAVAKLPVLFRNIGTPALPAPPNFGPNWATMLGKFEPELRMAHRAHQSNSALPALLAWSILFVALSQMVIYLVALGRASTTSWMYFSMAVGIAGLALFVATVHAERRRWRMRAPFEWRFITTVIGASRANRAAKESESQTSRHLAKLATLEGIERLLVDRIEVNDAPSSLLARADWAERCWPLSNDLAVARTSPVLSISPDFGGWIERAAEVIDAPAQRNLPERMRSALRRRRQAQSSLVAPKAAARDADLAFVIWLAVTAAVLFLLFVVAQVVEGSIPAPKSAEVEMWFTILVPVGTAVSAVAGRWWTRTRRGS